MQMPRRMIPGKSPEKQESGERPGPTVIGVFNINPGTCPVIGFPL
ncbi:hypothetical protein SDC9_107687 [bioreactor metagenome]|uniref:Uncharacterized protein n=1 Tax=bioreactor metagenome TaxID=1076179 RepID=A0A645BCC2_9ZZZZ